MGYYVSKIRAKALILPLFISFSLLTFQRALLWGDPFSMWKDTVTKSPQMIIPRLNLANEYTKRGDLATAQAIYLDIIRQEPRYWESYNNLGNVYLKEGRWKEAERM